MLLEHLLLFIQLGLVLSVPRCMFTGKHGTTFTCQADNTDYSLERGLVSDNNRTTIVVLKSCRIINIDYESFDGLPNVHTIDLSYNKLTTMKLGVLDESQGVKKLNISYNLIADVPLGLFDRLPNLEVLDARGNKFNNFELGIFDQITKLQHLYISSNEFKGESLSPYLLDQTKKITIVDYSRNDMSKAPDNLLNSMEVLDLLNLESCLLTGVPKFAVQNNLGSLRHLILSNNQIRSITDANTFRNLVGLQILDLSGNKIVSVHQNVFKPLRKLSTLMLRYNRIQVLPATIFDNLPNLGNLDLSHNSIKLVHETTFHGLPRLKRLNMSINRLTYLPPNFCQNLDKSGTSISKFYFNQNPWQCSCLKELLAEVKRFGVMYNSNKYKGSEPVCAELDISRFSCSRSLIDSEELVRFYDTQFNAWAKS